MIEVERLSDGKLVDIQIASWLFFAVRRRVYGELGVFDEAFHHGYYEETNCYMRALEKGYQVVVDDSLYIYYFDWGSFATEGRNSKMQRNHSVFMER